jgi:hypothetical protein
MNPMSRLLTMTELYSLVLHYDIHKAPDDADNGKNTLPQALALNTQSPVLWVGSGTEVPSRRASLPPRRVGIAPELADRMHDLAAESGLSEAEAWSEAAQTWIAQRQHDMLELASPVGRTLAAAVQRVWLTIDDQMRELRG